MAVVKSSCFFERLLSHPANISLLALNILYWTEKAANIFQSKRSEYRP